MLFDCPDCSQNPPALADSNIVWVTKWVDYSNKYGFGFMLSNDAMGVLFNDTSRILMSPEGRSVTIVAAHCIASFSTSEKVCFCSVLLSAIDTWTGYQHIIHNSGNRH